MKTKILYTLTLMVGFIAFYSCNDDDDPITPTTTNFTATLDGASEVPSNNSTATGTGTFTYNPVTRILSGTVTYTGLTNVTNGHIHKGAVGETGGPVVPFTTPFTSPINFQSVALTQAQVDDLMNNLYYVNIHTQTFPDGEIRGQLIKQGSVNTTPTTFNATINGASEVPANASTATGTGVFSYNPVTKILTGTVTYTGVTATNAHIHKGAAGVSGGVVFPLTPLASPIAFISVALTTAQANDLFANLYYVNIHSAAFPDGEIRGQMIKQTTGGGGGGTGY